MNRRQLIAGSAVSLASTVTFGPPSFANAEYPDKPIRVLVSFAPGGVADVVARFWAEATKAVTKTVVIENAVGAGGIIAASRASRAPADGYTLLMGNSSDLILAPSLAASPPYDPVKDFAPIAMIGGSIGVIMVHPSVPAKNLKELVEYSKTAPKPVPYGSAGIATSTHLSFELFKRVSGASNFLHVPYRGTAPGVTDLVAGQIPVMSATITGTSLELHRSGKARILVATTANDMPYATDVPNSVQAGYPDLLSRFLVGLFAPAKTPQDIIDKLVAATQSAMKDKVLQEKLIAAGVEPILGSDPQQTAKLLRDELQRWTPVIEASGLKKG